MTLGLSLAPLAARAQEYPQGVIKIICPFGPGAGADIKCRWYAPKLAEALKRTVIVENRPGAFGNIASETDRKSTRLNSSHIPLSRMPSSA